jgi:uncharacterized protein (DUF342 family)
MPYNREMNPPNRYDHADRSATGSAGRDGRVDVEVGDGGMTARVDVYPSEGDGRPLTTDLVREALKSRNIVYGIDRDLLRKVVRAAEKEKAAQVGVVIARGTGPEEGRDGEIEFLFSESESAIENHRDYKKDTMIE